MKIIVNIARCSGHARCSSVAPDLFRINDNGYIDVDDFDVPPELEDSARKGVRACPERALKISDLNDHGVLK